MEPTSFLPGKWSAQLSLWTQQTFASLRVARVVLLVAAMISVAIPWSELAAQQASDSPPPGAASGQKAETTSGQASGTTTGQRDVPGAPAQTPAPLDAPPPQTKRILEIVPNFRAISADQKLPPQTVKEKFITCTEDSFDYSSIGVPLLLAGYSMATKATPEFGQGAAGYARYFWHTAVDQTSENYMVEFVVPALTREDTRYYTLGRGGFLKRAGYALSRAVVTRSDSGKNVFNASEIVGAGAAAGISNLYYPSRETSLGNTGKNWGIDVAVDGMAFVAKEFWPDVNHWLFHGAKSAAAANH
jgi:hypothetical protein